MFTALLTSRNNPKLFILIFSLILLSGNLLYSAVFQIPKLQSTTTTTNQKGAKKKKERKIDKEDLPKKLPRITVGPIGSINYYNIAAHTDNSYPDWDGTQFSLGCFFDIRMSNYFGFKFSYQFEMPFNMLDSTQAVKAYHLIDIIFRYILALKHQFWIGIGVSMHVGDSFADYNMNLNAYNGGLLSNPSLETELRIIYFFNIYMGYYLKVTDLIVLDFTASYGLFQSEYSKWRYNSLRINFGVGFQL